MTAGLGCVLRSKLCSVYLTSLFHVSCNCIIQIFDFVLLAGLCFCTDPLQNDVLLHPSSTNFGFLRGNSHLYNTTMLEL